MDYDQLRKDILKYLYALQGKGFSYQSLCDHINDGQDAFMLFKDFFSRFLSKSNHYKNAAKQEKLSCIHQYLQVLYHQNVKEEDNIVEALGSLVSSAAAVKFEAFIEVNRPAKSRPTQLTSFYAENSPAYHSIKNYLLHKEQYGWELDILHHGSTFKILSFQIGNLFNQSAVVTTKEFWKLCWVDKTTKKLQFKLETLGEQTYLLSQDGDGNWKVFENINNNRSHKVEPEYIDQSLLKQLVSADREQNRATANNYLAEDDPLRCIEFIKTAYSDELSTTQLSLLNRARESCLNSYRLLNIDAINFGVYKSEMEFLKKQVKLIYDGIFINKILGDW